MALTKRKRTMISNYLYYQWSLAGLLVWRNIDFRTWRYAAWHRPIAVAGRGGSWIVDARADSYAPFSAARGVIQLLIGLLVIAGAVGWLSHALSVEGFNGAAILTALRAAVLIGIGLVVALDAAILLQPVPRSDHDHS